MLAVRASICKNQRIISLNISGAIIQFGTNQVWFCPNIIGIFYIGKIFLFVNYLFRLLIFLPIRVVTIKLSPIFSVGTLVILGTFLFVLIYLFHKICAIGNRKQIFLIYVKYHNVKFFLIHDLSYCLNIFLLCFGAGEKKLNGRKMCHGTLLLPSNYFGRINLMSFVFQTYPKYKGYDVLGLLARQCPYQWLW